MDQPALTEHVHLTRQGVNALLHVRYRDEAGRQADADTFPRYVVRELLDAGVVTHTVGFLALTQLGRTCGVRNKELREHV